MAAKAPEYVYVLTNPSFREDWVKGKSSRPVDIRSKEHDDTTVPLLFEVSVILRNCQIRLYLNKALCASSLTARYSSSAWSIWGPKQTEP